MTTLRMIERVGIRLVSLRRSSVASCSAAGVSLSLRRDAIFRDFPAPLKAIRGGESILLNGFRCGVANKVSFPPEDLEVNISDVSTTCLCAHAREPFLCV